MPVASQINMLPSRHDRLDPLAWSVRWWISTMRSMMRSADASADAGDMNSLRPAAGVHQLDLRDCFLAEVELPPGSPEQHRRAIELRFDEIAPLNAQDLCISAIALRSDANGSRYRIAVARARTLESLSDQSREDGERPELFAPAGHATPVLRSRSVLAADKRQTIFDAALVLFLAALLTIATAVWTDRLQTENRMLSGVEREMRREAVDRERLRAGSELARSLEADGILQQRPGAALDALAKVNAAIPDTTWLTAVRWSPGELYLTARSEDATAALEMISQDALRWSVAPSGPISSDASGESQTFDIRLVRRGAADDSR